MAQAEPLTPVDSVSVSLAPMPVGSDVSSDLGSHSYAQQSASRQAPQYHHVNLFPLFSVACRYPRPQSPATTLSAWSSTHTHTHTLQLGRSHDSWVAMLHVSTVGAASARAHCSCECSLPSSFQLTEVEELKRRFVQLPVARLALTGATNPTELIYLAFDFTPATCQAAALPLWRLVPCATTRDSRSAPHHIVVQVTDKYTGYADVGDLDS